MEVVGAQEMAKALEFPAALHCLTGFWTEACMCVSEEAGGPS